MRTWGRDRMLKMLYTTRASYRNPMIYLVLALFFIAGATRWADGEIKQHIREYVSHSLHTIIDVNHISLDVWIAEHWQRGFFIANSKYVKEVTQKLLALEHTHEVLLSEQAALRKELAWLYEVGGYQDFYIFTRDNINLVAGHDENIGKISFLADQPGLLEKLWQGEPIMSHPRTKINEGSDHNNESALGEKVMFVGVPIKDAQGNVLAALTLELNPAAAFYDLFKSGTFSGTGEMYIFDANGMMLSESKFLPQLYEAGLLAPGQSAIGNLRISDPGFDLIRTKPKSTAGIKGPLTRMVKSAILNGKVGDERFVSDMDGYRDYRGVPVVGEWKWDTELNLGLVIEQDLSEAFEPYYFFRTILFSISGFLALLLSVMSLNSVLSRKALEKSQARLQGLVDTLADGVIVVDTQGIIESINPAIEKLFGYSEQELKGHNVKKLMPARHQASHHAYLENFQRTANSGAIDKARELSALRKDGSEFPIELGLSEMQLGGERHFTGIVHDISERKKAEAELLFLNNEMKMMALVARETDNAVIISDQNGYIKWANQGFTRISEYEDYEVYGQQLETVLLMPDVDAKTRQLITEAFLGRKKTTTELMNHTKSGTPYWVMVEISPVYDSQDELSEFIILERDITEMKAVLAALHTAKESAEQGSRSKSAFLAAMSHEIRTPMNGVVGMIDVLQRTRLDERQKDLTCIIRDSAFSLMGIIDDILDFSKIEAGRMELDEVPTNYTALAEGVGETLLPLAEHKHVQLIQFCDPRIPGLRLDPVRVRQVLFNLCGNAVKFAAKEDGSGRVVLRTDLLEITPETNRARIRIQIEDNGIGMSDEVQQRLFRPFIQAEESTTRRFGGTGLGLVICRRLVNMMGGTIEIQSEEGKGSIFNVILESEIVPEAKTSFIHDLTGVTVLLHSSDATVLSMLSSYLDHAGARVISETEVEGCEKRLDVALQDGDDLVVVHVDKEIDAETMVLRERFKHLPKERHSGLVIVNNQDQEDAIKEDDKIFSVRLNSLSHDNFIRMIGTASNRVHVFDEVMDHNDRATTTAGTPVADGSVCDKDELILLAEDNKTNVKVITYQLGLLGFSAEVAINGKEALELWRKKKYDLVLTDCHMPEMDGYELATAIRDEEGIEDHVPILAITADAIKGTRNECLEAGMDDYLTKPLQVAALSEKLSRWLPSQVKHEQESVDAQAQTEASAGEEIVNISTLVEAIGTDDKSVLVDFYTDFLSTLNETATEIEQAYEKGMQEELGGLAHRLKSSAGSTGALKLYECCVELEQMGRSNDQAAVDKQIMPFRDLVEATRSWVEVYIAA